MENLYFEKDKMVIEKFSSFLDIKMENDLSIYQYNNNFKYGSDSFYLADFCIKNHINKNYKELITDYQKTNFFNDNLTKIEKNRNIKILDICAGSGIIGILLKSFFVNSQIDFLEIQKDFTNLIHLNLNENFGKEKKSDFNILNLDSNTFFKNLKKDPQKYNYNVIISNPPYWNESTGLHSKNDNKNLTRKQNISDFDILEDIFNITKYNSNNNTELYLVHKPEFLQTILCKAKKYNLPIKTLQFVHHNKNKAPGFILMKFIKNSKSFLRILPPIFLK